MFCKSISEDDALQGALGNCFAIAAFGTWAGVKGGVVWIKIGPFWMAHVEPWFSKFDTWSDHGARLPLWGAR